MRVGTIQQVRIPYLPETLVSNLIISRRLMIIEVLIILNIIYNPRDYIVLFNYKK